MDRWITPTTSSQQKSTTATNKRQLTRGSPEVVDLVDNSRQERNSSGNDDEDGSPAVVVDSVLLGHNSSTDPKRPNCQYGSKCYRRNPVHLLEFSHSLLESVYEAMAACGDFSTVPVKMLREVARSGVDSEVLMEQTRVLKSVGFSRKKEDEGEEGGPPEKIRKIDNSGTPGSSSQKEELKSDNWKDALEETKQMRRKKYLESLGKEGKEEIRKDTQISRTSKDLSMLDKWNASCPFNFFLTKVTAIPEEKSHVLSCNFKDLFDPSLGEVKALFHANFMIEMEWFMDQVMDAGVAGKNTWLVFDGDNKDMQAAADAFPWLKINGVKSPFPFGHHHTKMSIVQYTDESVRFFIYTANLIESDWDNRTQGVWISPRCPKLVDVPVGMNAGDSSTKFKSDIIQYLQTYPVKASAAWIHVIKAVDCSQIKVYFVASAPVTSASGSSGFQWAQAKLDKILKSHDGEVDPTWPLVIQCSSIGSLGKGVDDWVRSELAKSMAGKDRIVQGPVRVIYPSHSNVQTSFDGLAGGGCLPYGVATHTKQPWLEKLLCQWKADCVGRSRAVPHIKGYCRVSPDSSKLAWFLLTSANLSKAAWGKFTKKGDRLSVMSWEAGVLFHPSSLLTSQSHFNISGTSSSSSENTSFPMPFDIPVTKYDACDKPWFMDTLQALIMQQQLRKQ